ncbi:dihydrofolate reductase family protein [Asanoa sp. NPDC050611]|uniref:RibD family protein n=1 Tax=Asanoa sp. NPDC050611 TaxID=3157098 RepID=UPI003411ACB3
MTQELPRVVVAVTATADGRVTLGRGELLLDPGVHARWRAAWPADVDDLLARRAAAIEATHHPTVVLEGSGTFVGPEAGPLELPDAAEVGSPSASSDRWFAVVDRRGRVRWTRKQEGDTRLLVIVDPHTPARYLAYLRREDIPYLCADDLTAAVRKLRTELGATCVLSEAGGGLNGALLRAGLVDELHVITVPALVGGLDTPSVMDGPPAGVGSLPTRLRTIDVKVGSEGTIWAHYEVVR